MEESFNFMNIFAVIIIVVIIFIYCYQKNRDSDMIKYLNNKFQQSSAVSPQQFNNPAPVPSKYPKLRNVKLPQRRKGPVRDFHQSFSNFDSNRLGWRNVYDSKNNKDIPVCQ